MSRSSADTSIFTLPWLWMQERSDMASAAPNAYEDGAVRARSPNECDHHSAVLPGHWPLPPPPGPHPA